MRSRIADVDPDMDSLVASCLEQIEREQSTAADCLAEHPDLALELGPILNVARRVYEGLNVPAMQPAAVRSLETQLISHAVALRRQRSQNSRGLSVAISRLLAVSVLLIFLLLGGGVWVASANSLPGSPFYPVKRASEDLQLSLTQAPAQRAVLHVTFAVRRLNEALHLSQREHRWDEATLRQVGEQVGLAMANVRLAQQGGFQPDWERIFDLLEPSEQVLAGVKTSNKSVLQAMDEFHRFHEWVSRERGKVSTTGVQKERNSSRPTNKATPQPQPDVRPSPAFSEAGSGKKGEHEAPATRERDKPVSELSGKEDGEGTLQGSEGRRGNEGPAKRAPQEQSTLGEAQGGPVIPNNYGPEVVQDETRSITESQDSKIGQDAGTGPDASDLPSEGSRRRDPSEAENRKGETHHQGDKGKGK